MIEFLNPTFLTLAAAAAAVPILIHLLRRNKAVRVDFAAMRFLLGSSKPIVRWLRLKQLLILLLRILAVVVLGLAFARPFFPDKSGLPLWKQNQREVAIILDCTASMQAADHLQRGRQALETLLDELPEGTPTTVVATAGESVILAEREAFTPALKARILTSFQPALRSGRLRGAVQAADEILSGSPVSRREIYIVSDLQTSCWAESDGALRLNSRATVNLLPASEGVWRNLALLEAEIPEDSEGRFACSVRNFGGKSVRRAVVKLVLAGKEAARKTIAVPAGETRDVQFSRVRVPRAAREGYFELQADGDQFAADNRYYFVLNRSRRISVLAVNGEASNGAADELFFVRRALSVPGAPFDLAVRRIDRVKTEELAAFDAVLLANVKGMNHRQWQRIEEFVRTGGGLVFAPGDQVDRAFFNRIFASAAGVRLEKPARQRLDRSSGEALLPVEVEHPLLAPVVNGLESGLSSALFFQYWRLIPAEATGVVARFGDGSPAIATREFGQGKVVVLAFPLDGEWSDLPLKTAYVPLLYSLFDYVAASCEQQRGFLVGEPIYLGGSFVQGRPLEVVRPDGEKENLAAGTEIYSGTSAEGIYRFRQGALQRRYAVNVDRAESRTEVYTPEKFQAFFVRPEEVTSIDARGMVTAAEARDAEARQKLWRLALALVFVFLLAETWLANRTPR